MVVLKLNGNSALAPFLVMFFRHKYHHVFMSLQCQILQLYPVLGGTPLKRIKGDIFQGGSTCLPLMLFCCMVSVEFAHWLSHSHFFARSDGL